jgi:phosphoribosylglycinamide formyltransferase-1
MGATKSTINIAVFASGAGSNALKIIEHFSSGHLQPIAKVALIVCNKPTAGVLQIAADYQIPTLIIEKEQFFRGDSYLRDLQQNQVDLIVLAGFLWKIPAPLVGAYRERILNIHPALLPKYGGKGMYGNNVHAAVIAAGETESGITIHLVDEHYDNGDILLQATCSVNANDTPVSLATKIHRLEHEHLPKVVEEVVRKILAEADSNAMTKKSR